ncbi:hypothetical protein [Caballeronia sp. dw_19]|uniref:hypothetical protein n=1 Tax=Caballeronia sp. dw_19 TaxID=2719791 RepID=UPI001BD3D56E|nr:hypothetical protein [Caballeronia sp. dw_19]
MRTAITLQRQALYIEVWKTPIYKVAERYGITGAEIRKICKELAIPMPLRSHWPRIQAGHAIEPDPLPDNPGEQSYTTYAKVDSGTKGGDPAKAAVLNKIDAEESDPANRVVILSDGPYQNLHVKKLAARLKFIDKDIAESKLPPKRGERFRLGSIFNGKPGGLIHPGEGYLQILVTPAMRDRALRLADGFIAALSSRGFQIKYEDERSIVHLQDIAVAFRLTEITKKSGPKYDDWIALGQLRVTFRSLSYRSTLPSDIKLLDDPGKPIELQMNAFIGRLRRAVVGYEQRALEARQEAAASAERHRLAVEDADRLRRERYRMQVLAAEADRWLVTDNYMRYLNHVETIARGRGESIEVGSPIGNWLAWAREACRRADPTSERLKSLLSEPSKGFPEA